MPSEYVEHFEDQLRRQDAQIQALSNELSIDGEGGARGVLIISVDRVMGANQKDREQKPTHSPKFSFGRPGRAEEERDVAGRSTKEGLVLDSVLHMQESLLFNVRQVLREGRMHLVGLLSKICFFILQKKFFLGEKGLLAWSLSNTFFRNQ